ncbi:MAG: DUF2294 domain-containing protein [Solirubrobacteraceae bacterium MAG38_C4-C5]|nr:DUF2294 domain-containing protein [Candidatus Siliceabacter maunaloa]
MADEQHLPRLETASELQASGADAVGSAEDRHDSLRGRISHAMVGMKKDFYGKGPTKAKTFINDEYIFAVMEGG